MCGQAVIQEQKPAAGYLLCNTHWGRILDFYPRVVHEFLDRELIVFDLKVLKKKYVNTLDPSIA